MKPNKYELQDEIRQTSRTIQYKRAVIRLNTKNKSVIAVDDCVFFEPEEKERPYIGYVTSIYWCKKEKDAKVNVLWLYRDHEVVDAQGKPMAELGAAQNEIFFSVHEDPQYLEAVMHKVKVHFLRDPEDVDFTKEKGFLCCRMYNTDPPERRQVYDLTDTDFRHRYKSLLDGLLQSTYSAAGRRSESKAEHRASDGEWQSTRGEQEEKESRGESSSCESESDGEEEEEEEVADAVAEGKGKRKRKRERKHGEAEAGAKRKRAGGGGATQAGARAAPRLPDLPLAAWDRGPDGWDSWSTTQEVKELRRELRAAVDARGGLQAAGSAPEAQAAVAQFFRLMQKYGTALPAVPSPTPAAVQIKRELRRVLTQVVLSTQYCKALALFTKEGVTQEVCQWATELGQSGASGLGKGDIEDVLAMLQAIQRTTVSSDDFLQQRVKFKPAKFMKEEGGWPEKVREQAKRLKMKWLNIIDTIEEKREKRGAGGRAGRDPAPAGSPKKASAAGNRAKAGGSKEGAMATYTVKCPGRDDEVCQFKDGLRVEHIYDQACDLFELQRVAAVKNGAGVNLLKEQVIQPGEIFFIKGVPRGLPPAVTAPFGSTSSASASSAQSLPDVAQRAPGSGGPHHDAEGLRRSGSENGRRLAEALDEFDHSHPPGFSPAPQPETQADRLFGAGGPRQRPQEEPQQPPGFGEPHTRYPGNRTHRDSQGKQGKQGNKAPRALGTEDEPIML